MRMAVKVKEQPTVSVGCGVVALNWLESIGV